MSTRSALDRYAGGRARAFPCGARAKQQGFLPQYHNWILGRYWIDIDHTSLALAISRRSSRCVMVKQHADKGESSHACGMMRYH